MARLRPHMTYANVVSTACLFIVLGGSSYAAVQLSRNQVRTIHIAPNAVTSAKVRDASLRASDFGRGQLPAGRAGANGATGPAGATGATGLAGPAGAKGADATAPQGAVMFFNLTNCPVGWNELPSARGRYLVGLTSGGTLAGTAGTALTDSENRAVGEHFHALTGHSHNASDDWGFNDTADSGMVRRPIFDFKPDDGADPQVAVTALGGAGNTANTGTVAGTNAPYLQLLVCQKN